MLFVLLGVVTVGVGGCTIARLTTIESSDFTSLPGKIYVDPAIEEEQQKKMLVALEKTKKRIANLIGRYSATPIIIFVATDENIKKYGVEVFPGKTYIAPWETYVVVSTKIQSVDLLAHELMHAQISSLVGYWAYMTELPAWFDEGLAMQLDNRQRYDIENIEFSSQEILRIKSIESPSKFRTSSKEQDIKNYRAAKAAVKNLLEKIETPELINRLEKMKQGVEFSRVVEDL